MRGLNRTEKNEAVKLLSQGIKPADVSKQMSIPLSTITTWNKTVRSERKLNNKTDSLVIDDKSRKRERIKLVAKIINAAEAKITTAISQVIDPRISDQKWLEITQIVNNELKNIALATAEC